MPAAMIEIADAGRGEAEPTRSSVTIAAAVESLAYDVLERTHCGWQNSEGAYGDILFNVADGVITLNHNERYIATENYTHTF
jgi:hypothetical protein